MVGDFLLRAKYVKNAWSEETDDSGRAVFKGLGFSPTGPAGQ